MWKSKFIRPLYEYHVLHEASFDEINFCHLYAALKYIRLHSFRWEHPKRCIVKGVLPQLCMKQGIALFLTLLPLLMSTSSYPSSTPENIIIKVTIWNGKDWRKKLFS